MEEVPGDLVGHVQKGRELPDAQGEPASEVVEVPRAHREDVLPTPARERLELRVYIRLARQGGPVRAHVCAVCCVRKGARRTRRRSRNLAAAVSAGNEAARAALGGVGSYSLSRHVTGH